MADDPIRLDQVKPERIRFLWRERVPYGMISVFAGRPDQGKGLLAAHVAAAASRKVNVLYSAIEDSDGSMTRPRLEAAGCNMQRIHLWSYLLPLQLARLEREIRERKIRLVVIDPLAAHLSSGVSRNSDSIRKVTNPLKRIAERYGVAIVVIDHVVKRVPKNAHPLSAIGGSGSGLPSAARAAYLLGKDPDDEELVILAPIKFNIDDWPLPVAFEIDVVQSSVGEQPTLTFGEELAAYDAMRLLARDAAPVGRPPDRRAAAAEWLAQYLASAGQPVLGPKVIEDAKHYGMSEKTLRRAATEIGVIKEPKTGRNCKWSLNEKMRKMMGISPPPPGKSDGDSDSVDWDQGLRDLLGGDGEDG